MKKFIIYFATLFFAAASMAQSEKYQKSMEQLVIAVDTTRSIDGWKELGNSFQRIADVEKTQWLPYYYAAFSQVMVGYNIAGASGGMGGFAAQTDPLADQAEKLINKATELGKENSEIYVVRKMISSLRLMADPMNRYQTDLPAAAEHLQKAKTMDPTNPRVTLLEAQDKFYTPEEYGGSKSEAKTLFEEAVKKYEAFKPASSIHPQWGKSQVTYFMTQLK
jgi:tetratricopeptide (TPR) repeat protein